MFTSWKSANVINLGFLFYLFLEYWLTNTLLSLILHEHHLYESDPLVPSSDWDPLDIFFLLG
jgi:hypothetical protein